MVENNIDLFINYNYVPFKKSQCVKRLLLIIILSAPLCFIGNHKTSWVVFTIVFDFVLCCVFITLIAKFSKLKISRFWCDGLFGLYISIILNITSYRIVTLTIGENRLLFILFLFLMFFCIFVYQIVFISKIKANNYSIKSKSKKLSLFSFMGGLFGILTAKVLLAGQSQETIMSFLAFLLLLLSLIFSIVASVSFLKVLLCKKRYPN